MEKVDVAEPGGEIGDAGGHHDGAGQAVENGQPEIRRLDAQESGRRAVHAEAEEDGMAEGHHARVADQDVRGHGEEAPDENLRDEAAPELREHEGGNDEEREDDREAGPVRGDGASHGYLGVGTKRPVGRKSRVRIKATKDTITAWAGLTMRAA